MRPILFALGLALLGAAPADATAAVPRAAGAAAQGYPVRARVWLENGDDYYRRGERLRVLFSTSSDAYVAVVHVDTDGQLDFVFPASPFDDEFVRGGRVYSVGRGGWGAGPVVRGRGGIGYFYIVASPVPLDYRYFSGRGGYGWDWSYAGQRIHGDPFYALDQLTRVLLPDPYAPYAADWATYYVDGPSRYPAYACGAGYDYDGYGYGWDGRSGWGWNSYYGSCDRLDLFLRRHPYYFDSRRYSGDRHTVFRDYGRAEPRYGYKEDPEATRRSAQPRDAGPERDGRWSSGGTRPLQPEARPAEPAARPAPRPSDRPSDRPASPEARRPTLERRAEPREPSSSAGPSRTRPEPAPARPATPARRKSGGGS